MTMLMTRYGSEKSLDFTNNISRILAEESWKVGVELAKEKGPAPIMDEEFIITEQMHKQIDSYPSPVDPTWADPGKVAKGKMIIAKGSKYLRNLPRELIDAIFEHGSRYTHATSIAPCGTISFALANNVSNGIEPSYEHAYFRNITDQNKKTRQKTEVFSYELLLYRKLVDPEAHPDKNNLPDYFVGANDVTPKQHIDVQAAAQKWIDSSISKTINCPTNMTFEDFQDVYMYAWEHDLKGCATFRFNPEKITGVLTRKEDLENTTYDFVFDDGSFVTLTGDQDVMYDGEIHNVANLADSLKNNYYGKL